MKLIVINGPSCAGKSTAISHIMDTLDGVFYLSFDKTKRNFSKYESGKYTKEIFTLLFEMERNICEQGIDIISDIAAWRENREKIIEIAQKYNYEVIEINLESDFDVILERFRNRVQESIKNPEKKLANTSEIRLKEIFDIYQKDKNINALTLRTDQKSPQEIIDIVLGLIKSN